MVLNDVGNLPEGTSSGHPKAQALRRLPESVDAKKEPSSWCLSDVAHFEELTELHQPVSIICIMSHFLSLILGSLSMCVCVRLCICRGA